MGNGVQDLLEMLYTMVQEAWNIPLGAEKCVIERDKVLDILDEIKAQLPTELAEAKRLVAAKNEFVANAKREAESIRKVAEELFVIVIVASAGIAGTEYAGRTAEGICAYTAVVRNGDISEACGGLCLDGGVLLEGGAVFFYLTRKAHVRKGNELYGGNGSIFLF